LFSEESPKWLGFCIEMNLLCIKSFSLGANVGCPSM
jgi:hypothetical protein